MKNLTESFSVATDSYLLTLQKCFVPEVVLAIETLAIELLEAWKTGRNVYVCGNGGSAANAIHIANDLHYGIGACGAGPKLPGLRIEAMPSNPGVITCLANDTGYEHIYSHQIQVKARADDILIALSGSGNSKNIVEALEVANNMNLKTFAVLAFDGGRCKDLAQNPIHLKVFDMQIAEDTQLIVGHLCMQWLNKNKPSNIKPLR